MRGSIPMRWPLPIGCLLLIVGQATADPPPTLPPAPQHPAEQLRLGSLRFQSEEGNFSELVYSPDGTLLLACGPTSGHAVLFQVASGRVLQTLLPGVEAQFSPDGEWVGLLSHPEKQPRIWNVRTGQPSSDLAENLPGVTAWRFTPDGRLLVAAGTRPGTYGEVGVWELATGKRLFTPYGNTFALAADGRTLVTTLRNASPQDKPRMDVTRLPEGTPQATIAGEGGPIYLSPTGRLLVTTFTTGAEAFDHPRVYDARSGELLHRLQAVRDHNSRLGAISPDSRYFAMAAGANVLVYDLRTGKQTSVLTDAQPDRLAFLPTGNRLVTANLSSPPIIWDLPEGRIARRCLPGRLREPPIGGRDSLQQLRVSPTGSAVACQQYRGWFAWKVEDGQPLRLDDVELRCLAFAPRTATVAVAAQGGAQLHRYDLHSGQEIDRQPGHRQVITAGAFSDDGRLLATVSSQEVVIWDAHTGRLVRDWKKPATAQGIGFLPDNRRVITGGLIWDVAMGTRSAEVDRGSIAEPVRVIALSRDGERALVRQGRHPVVWDLTAGKRIWSYAERGVHSATLSPDGRMVAIATNGSHRFVPSGEDGLLIWDVATGKLQHRLFMRQGSLVGELSFLNNQELLCRPNPPPKPGEEADRRLVVLNAITGKVTRQIAAPENLLAVSHDTGRLVAWNERESTGLFETDTGRSLATLPFATHIAFFSRDGHRLAAARRTQLLVWDVKRLEEAP